ncbi:MAG: response regulator [Deferribacteres bacterium]|nr:response regulator [candidate division KSB1 bacterium]MCB9504426.1 response regulator [Deferribacteres bacterium]
MAHKNILLIDEDTMLLARTQKLLESNNYDVTLARSAKEARIALERRVPDLILLSSQLPDSDAHNFLEQVKENAEWRFLPVIVFTNQDELEDERLKGLRLGVMDYLRKPFKDEDLRIHIENILAFYEVKIQTNKEILVPSQDRLLKYMTDHGIRVLIPGVRRAAKLGYEYPEAAQILRPEELGGEIYILESMAKAGMLERVFHDTIHMCPDCGHHDLNFREICPQCQAADIDAMRMLTCDHCGFRSLENKFHSENGMQCPHCLEFFQLKNLDYDISTSAMQVCNECKSQFTEPIVNCRCMNCNALFDMSSALVRKIYSYKFIQNTHENKSDTNPYLKLSFAQSDIESLIKSQKLHNTDNASFAQEAGKCISEAIKTQGDVTVLALHFNKTESVNDLNYDNFLELFEKITRSLREVLRRNDLITIVSTDELHVLLPETSFRMARIIANRLLNSLKRLEYDLELQLNMASYPDDGVTFEQLLDVLKIGVVSTHQFSG